MYRLFDLDSKLEALCTAEEEGEESRMMGSSSGFRADESLQELAAITTPDEEFWFDQILLRLRVGVVHIGADLWSTPESGTVLLGDVMSYSRFYFCGAFVGTIGRDGGRTKFTLWLVQLECWYSTNELEVTVAELIVTFGEVHVVLFCRA
ncbi:hypothetical protein Pmar_PMAR011831 [Perkinsus marinus ATCC 50983]|uniref:Uncharacterized protein n=1 Tax=Perkinsus marinus (strain ATCC 50983 / TXsc) TaxID=423536 RepID=C5LBG2_PERM5|nr:hypothetical protein Pmar_PMAR011831 [Perkinsus marinus ATCC 50983]EER05783.1 hypothetical protein Pmar_PMAR011831 [Perkinsus marinus ATCC 50983]|eukprot:XP_002773967.1 hypothetical protein Pmar_PMAR011831 [Perkinsus marinus ATCC 50983]